MRTYIICTRRRGRPKVAIEVCKACRYGRRCKHFSAYRNPPLFPDSEKPRGNAIP